jgi:hypothetical protein
VTDAPFKIVDAMADDDFISTITIDHPEELPLHPRDMVRVRLPDSEVPKGMLERLQVLSFNESDGRYLVRHNDREEFILVPDGNIERFLLLSNQNS